MCSTSDCSKTPSACDKPIFFGAVKLHRLNQGLVSVPSHFSLLTMVAPWSALWYDKFLCAKQNGLEAVIVFEIAIELEYWGTPRALVLLGNRWLHRCCLFLILTSPVDSHTK